MTTKVARIRLETNAPNRAWSLGNKNPVHPNSCPSPATTKNTMNIGNMLDVSFRLLMDTGLPLNNGLNKEPKSMAGTRNRIAKSQNLIPTRQVNTRFSNNFNPIFPSNIAVMIIPAIEAERTEDNASSAGITP